MLDKRDVRQFELTILAVFELGGATKSIDTEDVAKRCHELAPNLFSWTKCKDQINLELVRVSLSDAKKEKNGELLSGSGRDGWRITQQGLEWMNTKGRVLLEDLQVAPTQRKSSAGSIDTVRRNRERMRIATSTAWQTWVNSGTISPNDARDIFRVDAYTTNKMLEIKLTRLRATFENDQEISPFLVAAARILKTENPNGS